MSRRGERMNDNLKIIREARQLVKNSSSELCNSYNELCNENSGETILSVLDGELRMAAKLAELEDFFSKGADKEYAGEFEISELKNKMQ